MKTLTLLLLLATGCSRFTAAQADLVTQARRGIVLCQQSQAAHREWIDRVQKLTRDRIDQAFDADVRQHDDISPDWIIEHRRAYTAALNALDQQRAASITADDVERANLQAVDVALQRLSDLQAVQTRWAKKLENQP